MDATVKNSTPSRASRLSSAITVRPATDLDAVDLIALGRQFHAESNLQDLTFSGVEFAKRFIAGIDDPNGIVLVATAEPDDRIVGFIMADIDNPYTEEFIAFMFLFYVCPEWRQTKLGRMLLSAALSAARMCGAARFYASSTAGFADQGRVNQTLLNLYSKMGFRQLGCFVIKEISDV